MAQQPNIAPTNTASQVLRGLAGSFHIAQAERDIQDYCWERAQAPITYSLGFRNGVEYGLAIFDDSFLLRNLRCDRDHVRVWTIPEVPGRHYHAPKSMSLHHLGKPPPLCDGQPNHSRETADSHSDHSVILSRCFKIGDLVTRYQGENVWPDTNSFIVVRSLGPPSHEGFWIIAGPDVTEEDHVPDTGEYVGITTEQMRDSRIQELAGYENKITYARIKEHTQDGQFELEERATPFVLSAQVWLTEALFGE
ncbi:hypothetical protein EV356DRAFT_209556 [Viridothelium virens]|uniref:Uncharacterized protein n=1 Tax=Viridothelium virens TaxID=1048519 RepID=A0A6A6H6T4_VIRVR|nr:hypothetical protein EV356DRAFT_209556 [Viridothelium virens]